MTETKAHTPTPYKAVRNAGLEGPEEFYWQIEGGKGYSDEGNRTAGGFSLTGWISRADAQFIVQACNAHGDLVEALKLARETMFSPEGKAYEGTGKAILAIEAALAKAGAA